MRVTAADESQDLDVPPEIAWAYRLDFGNLPTYNPDVSDLTRVSSGSGVGGDLGSGAVYRFALAGPTGSHVIELTVTSVAENTMVSATMRGALTAEEEFSVSPLGGGRCRATLRLWFDIPDGVDDRARTAIVGNGRDAIRRELDLMAVELRGASIE